MAIKAQVTRLIEKAGQAYKTANYATSGKLEIVIDAFRGFSDKRASQAAAGIAFYAMFSMFPLLAILVAAISLVVETEQIPQLIIHLLSPVVPVAPQVISENVSRFMELRGTVSIIGVVGLLWSGTNVFNLLMININYAWEKARYSTYIRSRLLAIAFLFGLVIFMLLALVLTGVLNLFARFSIPFMGGQAISETFLWQAATVILSPVITFLIFLLIYRFVPNTRVRFKEAFWGALVVTVLWELTSRLFRIYLDSGITNYDLIYGSIATLAVLMVWFNINSMLLLFGAHLSAAIARFRAKQKTGQENLPAHTI